MVSLVVESTKCPRGDLRDSQESNSRRSFLLQKVWLEREKRFATYTEMLGMSGYSEDKHQERLGVKMIKILLRKLKMHAMR